MAAGRFKIVSALFALAVLTATVMASYYFYQNLTKAEADVLMDIEALKVELPPLPDPGADRYEEARALLEGGELDAARNKLFYILKFYEESKRYGEAKRIIGEMNVDRLLTSEPMEGKVDYTVRSGDSLAVIAGRNESTVRYILRANNLLSTRIHPGDKLTVAPLHFNVVVKVGEKTLTLTREDQFFKEYPIAKIQLPYGARPPFRTTVSDKIAYIGDRRIPLTDDRFQSADKWIHTKVPGLVFGTFVEDPNEAGRAAEGENLMVGVSVVQTEFEELFTLLRPSMPVSVVP